MNLKFKRHKKNYETGLVCFCLAHKFINQLINVKIGNETWEHNFEEIAMWKLKRFWVWEKINTDLIDNFKVKKIDEIGFLFFKLLGFEPNFC